MSTSGPLTLASLQAQINQLQQQIAALQPSEALQPTYLTANPDGTVSADFTGTISAKGVYLDAAQVIDISSETSAIIWVEAADHSQVLGWLASQNSNGESSLQVVAQTGGAINDQTPPPGYKQGGLTIGTIGPSGLYGVSANAVTPTRKIIDENGDSDFVQLQNISPALKYQTANVTLPAGNTALSCTQGGFDPNLAFNSAGEYVAPTAGVYDVEGVIEVGSATSGELTAIIDHNGTGVMFGTDVSSGSKTSLVAGGVQCAAGDTVALHAYSSVAGPITFAARTYLYCKRIY